MKRACKKQLTNELQTLTSAAWQILPNYAQPNAEMLTIHLEINKHTRGRWYVETSDREI